MLWIVFSKWETLSLLTIRPNMSWSSSPLLSLTYSFEQLFRDRNYSIHLLTIWFIYLDRQADSCFRSVASFGGEKEIKRLFHEKQKCRRNECNALNILLFAFNLCTKVIDKNIYIQCRFFKMNLYMNVAYDSIFENWISSNELVIKPILCGGHISLSWYSNTYVFLYWRKYNDFGLVRIIHKLFFFRSQL